MRAFIYDKYGYYPDEEYSTSFEYQGWFFKLEICEKNDTELHSLRLLLKEINPLFTLEDILKDTEAELIIPDNL